MTVSDRAFKNLKPEHTVLANSNMAAIEIILLSW